MLRGQVSLAFELSSNPRYDCIDVMDVLGRCVCVRARGFESNATAPCGGHRINPDAMYAKAISDGIPFHQVCARETVYRRDLCVCVCVCVLYSL